MPVPAVTINFPMVDLTTENGPTRQIPGTQNSRSPIPNLANEPEWMKLSTVCPAPAGSGIFRDLRAGTEVPRTCPTTFAPHRTSSTSHRGSAAKR